MKVRDFDVVKYDSNMAESLVDGSDVVWYNADSQPFRLGGLPFHTPGKTFRRLPELPEGSIPMAVDVLAWHTAGGTLSFKTDSKEIYLRAKLHCSKVMDHMTAVGSAGFDIYIGEPGKRVFAGVTRFPVERLEYAVVMLKDIDAEGMQEFMINMPLYSGVESLEIGLTPGAKIAEPTPWNSDKKIVFYGTSITQGGCASRPGMCLTGILSRRWNREIVNLGFSGSGKGEPEVLELVAQVPDPELFVLDYVDNSGVEGFRKTLPGAIDIIRRRHPLVPIALITPPPKSREFLFASRAEDFKEACRIMQSEADRRNASGDMNVRVVNGTPDDAECFEYAVDGLHLTDLGFWRQAEVCAPELEQML